MNIEDLFTNLSYGELSNLSLSGEGSGTILEDSQPKIIRYANEGLLRLFSRFVLKQSDVLIEMVAHITNYHLIKKYAESVYNPDEVHFPYIKDLINEPFKEDVIKVLEVYTSEGNLVPLNDSERKDSVFTPVGNVLQVPRPLDRRSLSVMYQARHEKLDHNKQDQLIEIPEVLEGALTAFIAYKVFSHMNSDGSSVKAQEHMQIYENICNEAVEHDLVSTSTSTTNSRFEKRGWQ